jgi:nucleotidyltransferase/DNA polymerase involved in DNA repair
LTSIGIPVSIGMAATRIKAKIFSDLHKPLGYYISEDTTDNEQFTRLRVTKVPFIAKGTQEKLGI